MILGKIEELKHKLDNEIKMGCPYSQILKTSKEIDVLLAQYYLKMLRISLKLTLSKINPRIIIKA